MLTCDKCGKAVQLYNDALALHFLVEHGTLPGPMARLSYGARHLFPTDGCEGSPSRAQYVGGKRDTRGYAYMPDLERAWQEAYAELQYLSDGPRE